MVNSVVYESPGALAAAYDEIAAAYDEIGAKWTVWVHDGDSETTALLERAGHVLDANPTAMALDLGAAPGGAPAGERARGLDRGRVITEMGAINDRAYSFGGDSFSPALAQLPDGAVQLYVAHDAGEPVACTAIIDTDSNTEVQMVAVVPEARGRGLSSKLIAHALADAGERGQRTSTLVATKLGRPVYERLGFQALGVLEMWERRLDQG